ncbi:MAG: porin [Steroidobacteraceae bacterium]
MASKNNNDFQVLTLLGDAHLPAKRSRKLVPALQAGLLACTLGAAGAALAADPSSPERQIQTLQKQLEAVQAQLKQLADQNQALRQHQQQIEQQLSQQQSVSQHGTPQQAAPVPQPAQAQAASALPDQSSAIASATPAAPAPSSASASLPGARAGGFGNGALDNVRLWGYGEIYYSRPTNDGSRTQADLARAVFGIGYRFDSRTEFNSEYEVEHAVASSGDVGEFEVEQFYLDRQLTDQVGLRAGLFLMPFGLLNEHHEPTNFYGVQRNFVETLIIPSTWREGGLSFHGNTDSGIGWSAGLTTGLNLSGWEFAPEFPQYATALDLENSGVAPMQATHQELSLANGRDLSQYVSLSYFGVPGLEVGGAISSGKAVPPGPGSSRVTLWEGHARWTPGKADLSALYARGSISNVAQANLANPGSPNPIPSAFYGYFLQAAYGAWEHGDYRLNPFVRWEYYNLGSEYSGTTLMIPTGNVPLSDSPGDFGLWPQNHDRVWTVGANFYVTPHVVFKADYQWFDVNGDFNRFDLGLGLNF